MTIPDYGDTGTHTSSGHALQSVRFRIGELTNPLQSDPWFSSEQEAITAARELARDQFNTPIAVWEMTGCECVRIFYDGNEFRRT